MSSRPTPDCSESPCRFSNCRRTCGLEVIDELLRCQNSVRGEEVDGLLDLRSFLRRREDAESALALFCQLRRSMEERHYLSFYRLRRWFEHQVEANVRLVRGLPERKTALKLDWYCLEPVRFRCLQAVRQPGDAVLAPRVRFVFRPPAAQVEETIRQEVKTAAAP